MNIISLSGKKGCGKTTTAKLIKEILDNEGFQNVVIISWADALKREVSRACGVSVDYIETHKGNFRLILQGWGTDFRRELVSKCYWIEQLLIQLTKMPNNSTVIIPDTRFLNEVQALKELGAFLITIERDTAQVIDHHISENELNDIKDWDTVIFNDRSVDNLYDYVGYKLAQLGILKSHATSTKT